MISIQQWYDMIVCTGYRLQVTGHRLHELLINIVEESDRCGSIQQYSIQLDAEQYSSTTAEAVYV